MSFFLITGASRGIGFELARQLSRESSNIVIAAVRSISTELSNLQSQSENVHVVTCDLASVSSISGLASSLESTLRPGQKITHLINNAAVNAHPKVKASGLTPDILADNITTNVLGPATIVQVTLPFLGPNALIVNTTSGIGSLQLVSDGTIPASVASYSISKCALNMLSVHQAVELRGRCRVICLDPGHVKTKMGGEKAKVEIEDSAKGILSIVEKAARDEEGDREKGRARFINFLGEEVPW